MAKNISLMGADYPDVPAVTLPQTGGGTATFYDVEVTDGDPTLAWGTRSKVGTINGTDLHVTMPENPNTWRPLKTKTLTNLSLSASGNGNLALSVSNTAVISVVCTNSDEIVATPYRINTSNQWGIHCIKDKSTYQVVENTTSYSFKVYYYEV